MTYSAIAFWHRVRGLALLFGLFVAIGPANAQTPSPAPPQPGIVQMVVKAVSADGTQAILHVPGQPRALRVAVTGSTAPAAMLTAWPRDVVTASVDNIAKPTALTEVQSITRAVGRGPRIAFGAFSALLLLALAAIVSKGRLKRFIIGVDDRYSKSQFQLALWFGAVAVAYLTTVLLRIYELGYDYIGGVAMPENLLVLSGLSALSFGGAKMIAVQNQGAAPVVKSANGPSLLRDLTSDDDGNPDLGDFQMIVITLIAVALFTVSAFHAMGLLSVAASTSLPDVDSTLLSIFGLGQGAYLAKKVAVPSGKVSDGTAGSPSGN